VAINEAITLQVKVVRKSVCHTDQGKASERRRANTDEHGSTVLTVRVPNLHQTTNVMRVHKNRDSESETLTSQSRNNDGEPR
jgi:hypothetical protein